MADDFRKDASAASEEALRELRGVLKNGLEAIDAHPIGHMAVEVGRAKYQKRTLTLDDLLDIVGEGLLREKK